MGMIQDFQKAGKERQREVKQLQREVATMLKEFAREDIERRSEVADICGEVATMLRDFAAQAPERKATVASIANEATAIVEAANTFVKDLAKGSTERASDVAAIHEMVWGKAPSKKVAASPVEEVPVGELRDRVFAYLADHPDGTKLVELEEEFGVARIQIAKVIRALMDDNKVEKRDLLYFAI